MGRAFPAAALFLLGALGCGRAAPPGADVTGNQLTMALAWKGTAAEYEALYYQGFNVARMLVDRALEDRLRLGADPNARPLAVVTDVDDTVLDTRDYWRTLLADGGQLFDDTRWDTWVAGNSASATPGAIEFLAYCVERDVEIFYITNRDQGARTEELARANLTRAGLPLTDPAYLTVLTGSSDKERRQLDLAEDYEIVAYLGDNLNDFRRAYYVPDVGERRRLMTEDRADFGTRFVLFPNPTDGHWIRAILGESEPAPSADTLARFQVVAAGR